MPELPEVETVARGLAAAVEGKRILRAQARRPDLRFPLPPDLSARLEGRRLERIGRRAKYMLLDLDDGTVVILHLGMSGRLLILNGAAEPPEPPGKHDHVIFDFEGGCQVRFNDVRRFGMLDLCAADALAQHPHLRDLGPEPLGNDFNGPALAAALKGRRTPIKAALLDQRTVAGLGNIYVCEALFRAGLSPKRIAATVQGKRAEALAAAVKSVLNDAIASGGSSLRDYVQPSGELGYFQHQWAVYGREGERCPGCDCDPAKTGGIRRIVQSGRSTFYCSRRQR
jgi:formamidopyrimidine-DNA glycosylase